LIAVLQSASKITNENKGLKVAEAKTRFQLEEALKNSQFIKNGGTQASQGDTFYVKYNRSAAGRLKAGDVCPDVPLINAKGERTTLFAAYRELAQSCAIENKEGDEPPLVLIAGSAS